VSFLKDAQMLFDQSWTSARLQWSYNFNYYAKSDLRRLWCVYPPVRKNV